MLRPQTDPRPRSGEAGFSLLETLIAAAVLLLILIGILPLFERSRMNLMQGNDATKTSNAVVDLSERLLAENFNSFTTNIPSGATESVITDNWLLNGDQWSATVPAGDQAQLVRTVTIQQFSVADATDSDTNAFETALDGGEPRTSVHAKRFQIEITNPRTGGNVFRVVSVQTK
jgi:Tfp pilus assembly protein PilV